jgi:hypothetical protein
MGLDPFALSGPTGPESENLRRGELDDEGGDDEGTTRATRGTEPITLVNRVEVKVK